MFSVGLEPTNLFHVTEALFQAELREQVSKLEEPGSTRGYQFGQIPPLGTKGKLTQEADRVGFEPTSVGLTGRGLARL